MDKLNLIETAAIDIKQGQGTATFNANRQAKEIIQGLSDAEFEKQAAKIDDADLLRFIRMIRDYGKEK